MNWRGILAGSAMLAFGCVSVEVITAAQTGEATEKTVYMNVDVPPEFPDGQRGLMLWLAENVRYPVAAAENGIQGRVIVRFVVAKDGSVRDAAVLNGVEESLDREALRVVRMMPKWIPGKKNDETVDCYFTLPVSFKLK